MYIFTLFVWAGDAWSHYYYDLLLGLLLLVVLVQ